MSEKQMVSLTYHQRRERELLKANSGYVERARSAERELKDLKVSLQDCEADAFELAETIISTLLPDADDAKKRHEATILSQRLYDFVQDFL